MFKNNIAQAGRKGDSVRSDTWVEIRLKEDGGINIELQGKAAMLHPDSTKKLLLEGLSHFGIENVNLTVLDNGALPFVTMARLETAVIRLNPEKMPAPWLPSEGPKSPDSLKNRSRRSRLYLPGNEAKFMINAALHKPDGLILDLEDSVSADEKDAARVMVRNALVHLDFMESEKMVRINQGKRGLDDLKWVVPYGVQLILLPKVESPRDILDVVEVINQLKIEYNLEYSIWLMPIIESAKGAWFAYDIACAHDTIASLAIGLEDYTADIGVERTDEGIESFWARSQVVNGAKAAGVQAIDTVYSDVGNQEGLEKSVQEAKSIGFEGKGCIHPRQIEVVKNGFAPTEKEIEKAKKITLAFEEAQKKGLGVVSLGRKMIDPPVVKRALRIIKLAESEGRLSPDWRESKS